MRTLTLLLMLLAATSIVYGQEPARPKYSKITDPGAIYSTPNLCESNSDYSFLVTEIGAKGAALICPYAEEEKWPSAIETFAKRDAGGREKMKDYNAWYVADIESSVLLWISLEENGHMPEDMRDKTDFMVLIRKDAVNLGDKVVMNLDEEEESTINLDAVGFADQLDNIVADYANGFKTIKGDSIPREGNDFLLGKQYYSKIILEGSVTSQLSADFLSQRLSFSANFGDFTDSIAARRKFDELVKKFDEASISCCRFVKLDESPSDAYTSQAYIPFDLSGTMPEAFKDMVIQVTITKGFDISDDWTMTDEWYVRLSVSKI